jgi:hypothetical protein
MPQKNPGTLSSALTADIIAQVLKADVFVAGAEDLPRSAQLQQMVRIDAPKPAG